MVQNILEVLPIYLILQHGDLVREEACNVVLPKGLGQEVAHGGAHCSEQAGQQQSEIRPEYSSSKNVLQVERSCEFKAMPVKCVCV